MSLVFTALLVFTIDLEVLDITHGQAVLLSLGGILVGGVFYEVYAAVHWEEMTWFWLYPD